MVRSAMLLEQRLDRLATCGIRLHPDRRVDELLAIASREELERGSYLDLLLLLGSEVEEPPWGRRFSDAVWHLDFETFEGEGSYVAVAERVRAMSGGALELTDVQDGTTSDGERAWLSFSVDGRPHRWTFVVEDDWLDPSILSRFAALLRSREGDRRLMRVGLGGQDTLLFVMAPTQARSLAEMAGIALEPWPDA